MSIFPEDEHANEGADAPDEAPSPASRGVLALRLIAGFIWVAGALAFATLTLGAAFLAMFSDSLGTSPTDPDLETPSAAFVAAAVAIGLLIGAIAYLLGRVVWGLADRKRAVATRP